MTAPALDLDALEARLLDAERNDLLVEHGVRFTDIKWLIAAARERDALNAHLTEASDTYRASVEAFQRALAAERQRAEQAGQERDGWERTAAEMANGIEFYRDIVRKAGAHFGPAAYTSDDGSVQDEVLALKVPQLAAEAVAALAAERRRAERLQAEIDGRRMCVNCGRTAPADHPRHDPLPECVDPESGMAACTFDMTLDEAWQHWRQEAHAERQRAERAEQREARMRAELATAMGQNERYRRALSAAKADIGTVAITGSRAKAETARARIDAALAPEQEKEGAS